MRAVILTGKLCQDQELIYPYYRLQEAGYKVDVAVRGGQQFHTFGGLKFEPSHAIEDLQLGYDLLVVPGGIKAMEHMRLDPQVIAYIEIFHERGGIVASICSGAMLLISAGLVKGRKIATYPAWRVDVENAGGEFVDAPAVIDDRIVTSTHYRHVGPWMAAALTAVQYPNGF